MDPGRTRWRWPAAGMLLALACKAPNPAYRPGVNGPDAAGADVLVEVAPEAAPPADVDEPAPVEPSPDLASPDLAPEVAPPEVAPPEAPPAEVASEVAPSALVIGHWPLDGNTSDVSGSGHHGALMDVPPAQDRWVLGQVETALNLPNVNSQGVLVALTERVRNLSKFTIAAWTRRTDLDQNRQMSVLSRQYIGTRDIYNLTLDGPYLKIYVCPDPANDTIESRYLLPDPTAGWIHVAATFNGTQLQLYVGGQPVGVPASYAGRLQRSEEPLYLGTNKNAPDGIAQPFFGVLDDVWLLSDALRPDEISHLMTGQLPPGR